MGRKTKEKKRLFMIFLNISISWHVCGCQVSAIKACNITLEKLAWSHWLLWVSRQRQSKSSQDLGSCRLQSDQEQWNNHNDTTHLRIFQFSQLQHTGPTNQSESIVCFWGSGFIDSGSQPVVQMTEEKVAYNKFEIYENKV